MKTFSALSAILIICLLVSCDRKSCESNNPIFLEYSFKSQKYKTELAKQIESIGQENLRYWLHDYIHENNTEYVAIAIVL